MTLDFSTLDEGEHHVKYMLTAALLCILVLVAPVSALSITENVDDIGYDTTDARKLWKPMKGTAEVSVVEKTGGPVLELTCNFKDTKFPRASWDRLIKLDMVACRGLQFSFYCRDISPISHFSVYFKSGGGWYSTSINPGQGAWQDIRVTKEQTRIEGNPSGWGNIEAIRISAWRNKNADTELLIKSIGLLGGDSPIVIVRGSHDSAGTFASNVSHCMTESGLDACLLSESDLTTARLEGRKVIVLPHNPRMSNETITTIAAFLESGGNMISFYSLPGRLAAAAGVQPGQFLRPEEKGTLTTIRPKGTALRGLPDSVSQASWNIQTIGPIEGKSTVAATWYDSNGKNTDLPAIVVSDRAVCMTHVLLDDDWQGKQRMLLAMVGRLLPELWKKAAEQQIARIGQFGSYDGFDSAAKGILSLGSDAAGGIAEVRGLKDQASDLVGISDFSGAIIKSAKARQRLIEIYCQAQRPQKGEQRLFWCHSAFGVRGLEWDEAIKTLADNGYTAILPNMLWGGITFYPSKVLPVYPEIARKGDQIEACLAACNKYGLECHVWKVCFNMGHHVRKEFVQKMKAEGRTQVDRNGKSHERWLCPSHPENQKLEIDAMVEVAKEYGVHGIHFDYIRYPGPEYCFCRGCRERFEERAGRKLSWPGDVQGPLKKEWTQFRCDQITKVVSDVSKRAREVRSGIKISAAVFRRQPADAQSVGQDWSLWCRNKYLDFICPMDYTPSNAGFDAWVTHQLENAAGVPCYPGIGLSVWPAGDKVVKLIEQINITRRLGTGGFTVFNYAEAEARDIVPLTGLGVTRK